MGLLIFAISSPAASMMENPPIGIASPIVLWGNKYFCTQCHYGPGLWSKNFGVTWDKHENLQIEISLQGNSGQKLAAHTGFEPVHQP